MSSPYFMGVTEPNEDNIVQILDDIVTRFSNVEQMRWTEASTDLKFWAGDQDYVYNYYNFAPNINYKKFFFNIIQQPGNMVTGFQRQHRKSNSAIPVEGSDQRTADQLSKLLTYADNKEYLLETFSQACEQAINTGMVLVQPYLDYSEDLIDGALKWKVWEYNSFMMDPYWRDTGSMSDCNFVWCQKYISKKEAINQFPDHKELIESMSGYNARDGRFYFLPENYNMSRNDLLVVSYFWYKSFKRKKFLFNRNTYELTDFYDTEENLKNYTQVYDELEIVERDVPTWKVATVINRKVLRVGENPMGFDECPFVPVYWNYDPHISQPSLRVRSMVRSLRDAQFLFNRRIIINHDISESSINSGWIYEENSIVNEEALQFGGQGKNIITKEGSSVPPQKIIPNAVPPSDLELANQLMQLIPSLSGVTEELMGMGSDPQTAGIVEALRQGAGLVGLQKYFDQWDRSLKQLGVLNSRIIQKKWTAFKIQRILNEKPTEQFLTRNFQKFDILPAEGLNTTVQRQQEFAQLLQFQQMTGIQIPPKQLLESATFHGKDKIIEALEQQQQQQAEAQQQQTLLEQSIMESKLENQKADTVEKLAMARERTGRTKSNVGLFEERISEVTQNRAKAVKEKVSALKELLDTIDKYGELLTAFGSSQLTNLSEQEKQEEDVEQVEGKQDSQLDSASIMNTLR